MADPADASAMADPAEMSPGQSPLAGKSIVLGVTGGISAYKSVELLRLLTGAGASVTPVLTRDAHHFVGPVTFEALSGKRTPNSLWDGEDPIPHTTLGRSADLVVVAPATAHLLAKYAAGLADDLLSATLIATRAPVLVAPAMHSEMWEHPATVANVRTLRARGVVVLEPEIGPLAGGDVGIGRLPEPAKIFESVVSLAGPSTTELSGTRVLVTAGGTKEPIDPVRYIGNRSSGKMGHALAAEALRRGAEVVLVSAADSPGPAGAELVRVETASEMEKEVLSRMGSSDLVLMAAAVADFRPATESATKIKKSEGLESVRLEPTNDILSQLVELRSGQVIVGFAAETDDLIANAKEKLSNKGVDLLVANDVSAPDSGFGADTNRATLLWDDGSVDELPLMSKSELAREIIGRLLPRIDRSGSDGCGAR